MKLFSWGANSYGQLGLGYKSEIVDTPTVVDLDSLINTGEEDLKNIKSVCGGGGHSLFLTEAGSVYGCGWNNAGQLDIGEGVITEIKRIKILNGFKIVSLASAWDTSYAITEDGLCLGWGSNTYNQLGIPSTIVSSEVPVTLTEGALQVDCGTRHCIILLKDGTLFSAGDCKYGQLGRNIDVQNHSFAKVSGLKYVKSISCGFNHTLALLDNGEVYAWGTNKWGQLGIDPSVCKYSEKPLPLFSKTEYSISSVHCGWSSSHLLTDDGRVINFGRNIYGQLGSRRTENTWKPTVLENITFDFISVGSEHTLGLQTNGKLVAWGWNEHGNCGNKKTENVLTPTEVSLPPYKRIKFFEAAAGSNFAIIEE